MVRSSLLVVMAVLVGCGGDITAGQMSRIHVLCKESGVSHLRVIERVTTPDLIKVECIDGTRGKVN